MGLTVGLTPGRADAYQFDDEQRAFEFAYLSTPIAIHGRVVDEHGDALVGAQLRLIGWGEGVINDGEATTSWFGGQFELAGLARRNVVVEVRAPGYYPEIIPIELQQPIDEDRVALGEITLVAEQIGRVRLSFAGDAMFGRRMFSRGLLRENSLVADTAGLFRYIEPLLWADDHTAINLESPVTERLTTPHPRKSFVFHSLPGSAAALLGVGVDSVSLGNNHVYDYLDIGLFDTLASLDAIGLPHYGAGISASHAAASVYRPTIHGVPLSLQGFCELRGRSYGARNLELIAYDRPSKPGALHASAAEIDAFVTAEVQAGRLAIPILHGGDEYTEQQSAAVRSQLIRAVERGAALVVAHHPHVVHGVQLVAGPAGPRYVFGSLGNFVFDQDIYETLRSYVAVVDLSDGREGPLVERVRLVPIVRDDYIPRLLVGGGLAKLGREVAHRGTAEATGAGLQQAVVFAEGGRLVVAPDLVGLSRTDALDRRSLTLDDGDTGVIALDPYTPTDALAAVRSSSRASCQLGRDRLVIGDFEDPDVDDRANEGDRWLLASHRYIQNVDVHGGVNALVLLRHASEIAPTILTMDRAIAVTGGRRMTVHGWHTASNAGPFSVRVRWLAADGSTLARTTEHLDSRGSFAWSTFAFDLSVPPTATGLMVEFQLASPAIGEGRLILDDLAFIEWDPKPIRVDVDDTELASPNGWDYLRCQANTSRLDLTLTHRIYASKAPRYRTRVELPTTLLSPRPPRRKQ
jgi:poly-gamma-glutamate capsule biosynthesis protein CapA/YwtB (metallophosphatase superfamily)